MDIYDIADYILMSAGDGARNITGPIYIYNKEQQKYVSSGLDERLIREGSEILLRDGHMETANGDPEHIRISAKGKIFRGNGGYKSQQENIRRKEDRELQRQVSMSVVETNESVKKTNESIISNGKRQLATSIGAALIAFVALGLSIASFVRPNQTKYRLQISKPRQQQNMLQRPESPMLDLIILPDSIGGHLSE